MLPHFKNKLHSCLTSLFFPIFLLCLLTLLLYVPFVNNQLIFDDFNFFNNPSNQEYLRLDQLLNVRWLPYATLALTRSFVGQEMFWFYLQNFFLHLANVLILFFLLKTAFNLVIPSQLSHALSPKWIAFWGALFFSLHPAAVYGAAYLIQRTILMATFFTLLMWYLFLQGWLQEKFTYAIASVAVYLLAVLCKEHAIMAPMIPLAFLFARKEIHHLKKTWPIFILYAVIGIFIIIQMKTRAILGQSYEIYAPQLMIRFAQHYPEFDSALIYPLSALTQSLFFFKYLLLWIIPNPEWMAIDMYEPFATSFTSWTFILGGIGFTLYGIIAIYLLIQGGSKGLFGLALLCPWFLFFTEFAAIRIQESFVIYRSYLWMPGFFLALPFITQKLNIRPILTIFITLSITLFLFSWTRLTTFSHPFLLWDDAARLIEHKKTRPGIDRIYYNRGISLLGLKFYGPAITDFNQAITLNPNASYYYYARGFTYFENQQYPEALQDYVTTLSYNPNHVWAQRKMNELYKKIHSLPQQDITHYITKCRANNEESICSNFEKFSKKPH
jgi:tetratricopeptide (TPR) repeat protein